MLPVTLTSASGNYRYIDRFDDITRLALATKAQLFYADSYTNIIYGFFKEHYSMVSIPCPFKITNSVFFAGYGLDKDLINSVKTFFYIDEYPYILFPENRRGDMMASNLAIKYSIGNLSYDENGNAVSSDLYTIIDKMTGKQLNDCIITVDPERWFKVPEYISLINKYYRRITVLGDPIIFENMTENQIISSVMSSKVSQGATFLRLTASGKNYGLFVFKSLLGPITKQDKLDIIIRPDKLEIDKFMITFRVTKRKHKIPVREIIGLPLVIETNASILNIL